MCEKKPFRVAVVGAGFSGLATAWHLLQYRKKGLEVVIFDPADLGHNASGISAGLLHPYAGPSARLVERGREGQAAAEKLLHVAANALGTCVAEKRGQLRLAITKKQKEDFYQSALTHSDIRWCPAAECQHMVPQLVNEPGIFITSSYTVDTQKYLQGLWQACRREGAHWEREKIVSLETLERHFDALAITAGPGVTNLLPFLSVQRVKGQIVEMEWPNHPLPFPINSGVYLVMKGRRCLAGATFEHTFLDENPDLKVAQGYLGGKLAQLFRLKNMLAHITCCRAGIRVYTGRRLPLIKQVKQKTWVLTGMGSKGLLYHALYAEELAHHIMHRGFFAVSGLIHALPQKS